MKNYIKHWVALLFLFTVFLCDGASVKLSVSPVRGHRDIQVGDMFYITYEITDSEATPETPKSVPGAKIIYFSRTGQSSRMSSINGKVTQSHSYTYTLTLRAQQEGSFSYGPVVVGDLQSNSIKYNIIAKSDNPSQPQQNKQIPSRDNDEGKPKYIGKGDGNLYLKAEVSKSTAYPQEAIVYTVKLISTYDRIKFIGATAAPKFDGFVVEESNYISNSLEYETINGKTYATAIIARYIIFPQIEGDLKIKGNTYTVSVDEREYYHDPFWGNMSVAKPLQLNVTPNDLSINVIPLPRPVPANFSGGVGEFKIESQLGETNLLSNSPATIKYVISGTGNIKYVTLPDLNKLYPSELEVYSPTASQDVTVGKTNVTGSITYDYSFLPLEAGNYKIPPVTLTFFNPSTKRYESVDARGYNIVVDKGKESEKSQTRNSLIFNPELLEVKSNLSFDLVPVVGTFGYWFIFFILPTFVMIAVIVYYRKYLELNSDIVLVRLRKANKVARKRLKKAKLYLDRKESDKFYDTLLSSLFGYLCDKLNIPLSDLNRQNIREVIVNQGIDDNVANEVIEIIDDCEFYKYSSAGSDEEMKNVYDKAANVIDVLENKLDTKKLKAHE